MSPAAAPSVPFPSAAVPPAGASEPACRAEGPPASLSPRFRQCASPLAPRRRQRRVPDDCLQSAMIEGIAGCMRRTGALALPRLPPRRSSLSDMKRVIAARAPALEPPADHLRLLWRVRIDAVANSLRSDLCFGTFKAELHSKERTCMLSVPHRCVSPGLDIISIALTPQKLPTSKF